MRYDPEKHHRRSIRLKDYDYSQDGAYYVTLCTQNRVCLFGDISPDGEMHLNRFGQIVEECWLDLPEHYEHVELDAFVIMPNHVHGILFLIDDPRQSVGTGLRPAPTQSAFATTPAPTRSSSRHGLSEIIRAVKAFSSRRINEQRGTSGASVWQRAFYDRVIRHEKMLNEIRLYIQTNPARWAEDSDNPANFGVAPDSAICDNPVRR